MRIGEAMTTDVGTCRPDEDLSKAAGLMWDNDCGIVPVVAEDGRLVGVLTDRDACMALATRGREPSQVRVRDVMTSQVATCGPEQDVREALSLMAERQVRRIPIIDDQNRLQGVFSLRDAAMHAGEELSHRDVAETLKAICREQAAVTRIV